MRQQRDEASPDPRVLVEAARAGDVVAFRRLVQTHMRAVHALALRMLGNHDDADDAAQETFVRAWEALNRYDPAFSVYTWLRTITTRLCLNELEKRKRRRTDGSHVLDAAAEHLSAPGPDASRALDAAREHDAVLAALEELPAPARAVLVLRAFEDMSYEQIAAALDIPAGTVMSRLSRARSQLRAAIDRGVRSEPAEGKVGRERPQDGVG